MGYSMRLELTPSLPLPLSLSIYIYRERESEREREREREKDRKADKATKIMVMKTNEIHCFIVKYRCTLIKQQSDFLFSKNVYVYI